MKLIATVIFSILSATITSKSYADTYSYPGGIAQLTIPKKSDIIPEVKFGLNEPIVMEYGEYWRILIGLSLDTLPGDYVVYIKPAIEGAPGVYEKIVVKQHIYPFNTYLRFDSHDSDQAVSRVYDTFSSIDFSNTQQPSLPLRYPVEGSWSNNFGHKLYDKDNDALHIPNAIVLSTPQVSTVVAPQAAIVSKIDLLESGLSTVFLDHGRGLYSILSGLDDITVEVGNGIVAGAVIGKLRASKTTETTRSSDTDNFLIWQTVINNTYIDPQILIKLKP